MIQEIKSYPAYKNSGLPWAGRLPYGWSTERAKWLFTKMDRPVRDEDQVITCFRDGAVTLRKNRRVRGFTESLLEIGYQGIRKGDLVIHTMDAFAGAVGVADSDGKGTPVYSVCQPKQGINAHYYAYVIREMARSQWILALARGIRERSTDFRFESFGKLRVPIPPVDEQASIVRFLDRVNRRIRYYILAKQKLIKLLEEQKQAIVQRAVTRGFDEKRPLKSSGFFWLGDIPQNWEVRRLGQIATSFRTGPFGSTLHQSDYVEGGTPIINPAHMRFGRIVEDPRCSVSPEVEARLISYRLEKSDLIFSRRGELGRCALVRDREVGWICGTGSIRVRIDYENIEPEYLIQALQVRGIGEFLSSFSVGATMDNLNTNILKRIPVPLPPLDEQLVLIRRIAHDVGRIERAALGLRREIDLIREYHARLTSDVVSGKLDVRGIQRPEIEGVIEERIAETEDLEEEQAEPVEEETYADN